VRAKSAISPPLRAAELLPLAVVHSLVWGAQDETAAPDRRTPTGTAWLIRNGFRIKASRLDPIEALRYE
jgi:hypothetical protein